MWAASVEKHWCPIWIDSNKHKVLQINRTNIIGNSFLRKTLRYFYAKFTFYNSQLTQLSDEYFWWMFFTYQNFCFKKFDCINNNYKILFCFVLFKHNWKTTDRKYRATIHFLTHKNDCSFFCRCWSMFVFNRSRYLKNSKKSIICRRCQDI